MATDWSSPQFVQQLLTLLAGTGPRGYTKDIRQNLGMDIQFGGPKKTSGMTGYVPKGTGYTPKPVKDDPLVPIIQQKPLPATPPVAAKDPNADLAPSKPSYWVTMGSAMSGTRQTPWWKTSLARDPRYLEFFGNSRKPPSGG